MRLSRLVTTALLTTLLATAFCGATRAADADLVIVHARVFDGRSEKLRDDAAVVIAQSKIVAVVDSAVAPAARPAARAFAHCCHDDGRWRLYE